MKRIQLLSLLILFILSSFASIAQNQNEINKRRAVQMGDYFYYASNDSLLKTDLKFEKVEVIKTGLVQPDQLTLVNGKLYFVNNKIKQDNDSFWTELWVCNGKAKDTYKIKTFKGVSIMIPFDNFLFFAADDTIHGIELWSTSGTESGTKLVEDINPGTPSSLSYSLETSSPVIFSNHLYFAATDKNHGRELWKSNGKENGTFLIKDIDLGNFSSSPSMLTVSGDYLYFTIDKEHATGKDISSVLYKTNGTESGTLLIKNFIGEKYSSISQLLDINGTLFFILQPAVPSTSHANELWQTTGTAWNTQMVIELDH